MANTLPTLYTFRRCPYAMRARMALVYAGVQVSVREVVLRDKPAEMLAASPKGTVPVLILSDGQIIDESLDVMHWALSQNDPAEWLSPDSATLITSADGPFKAALDRYKYPNRYDGIDRLDQRALGLAFLEKLDGLLDGRANLLRETVSLADIAIFPFVRQFANTDRAWFEALPLPRLQDWLARHLASDLFASVMTKYPQWTAGDAEPVLAA